MEAAAGRKDPNTREPCQAAHLDPDHICKGDWNTIWLPAPQHGTNSYSGHLACAHHAEVRAHQLFMRRMRLRGDSEADMRMHDRGSNPSLF